MYTVEVSGMIDDQGVLHLDVPTGLSAGMADAIVVVNPVQQQHANPAHPTSVYDFSDLVGKVKLAIDPNEYQRRLRNEWE